MKYKGKLADEYTKLQIIENILFENHDLKLDLRELFNKYHFQDGDKEKLLDVNNTSDLRNSLFEISLKKNDISNRISDELNEKINTIAWERLPSGKFDYSIPSTLLIKIY